VDDWHAVYDVLVRYAAAIDGRDWETVGGCFADDARATYAGDELGPGRAAIVGALRDALTASSSTHLVGGVSIQLDGDQASSEQAAVAFRVEDGRLVIRGLRYDDRLARRDGRWEITERVHRPIWTAEGGAVV
jgi:hypothetical protein